MKEIDRKLDELIINRVSANTVVHIKSYEHVQSLREKYWHNEFYKMSKDEKPNYFGLVHELSDLYAVDGIFGIDNSRCYFNRCIAKITEDKCFDYVPLTEVLRFADALFSTGHHDSLALFSIAKRSDFDENIFKAYLASPAREKHFYHNDA